MSSTAVNDLRTTSLATSPDTVFLPSMTMARSTAVISTCIPMADELAWRRIMAQVMGSTSMTLIHSFMSLLGSLASCEIFSDLGEGWQFRHGLEIGHDTILHGPRRQRILPLLLAGRLATQVQGHQIVDIVDHLVPLDDLDTQLLQGPHLPVGSFSLLIIEQIDGKGLAPVHAHDAGDDEGVAVTVARQKDGLHPLQHRFLSDVENDVGRLALNRVPRLKALLLFVVLLNRPPMLTRKLFTPCWAD